MGRVLEAGMLEVGVSMRLGGTSPGIGWGPMANASFA